MANLLGGHPFLVLVQGASPGRDLGIPTSSRKQQQLPGYLIFAALLASWNACPSSCTSAVGSFFSVTSSLVFIAAVIEMVVEVMTMTMVTAAVVVNEVVVRVPTEYYAKEVVGHVQGGTGKWKGQGRECPVSRSTAARLTLHSYLLQSHRTEETWTVTPSSSSLEEHAPSSLSLSLSLSISLSLCFSLSLSVRALRKLSSLAEEHSVSAPPVNSSYAPVVVVVVVVVVVLVVVVLVLVPVVEQEPKLARTRTRTRTRATR